MVLFLGVTITVLPFLYIRVASYLDKKREPASIESSKAFLERWYTQAEKDRITTEETCRIWAEQDAKSEERIKSILAEVWEAKIDFPGKTPLEKEWQTKADYYCKEFFDDIPRVILIITDHIGSETAHATCALVREGPHEVRMRPDHLWEPLLIHEITHSWINRNGIKEDDWHGPEFTRKYNEVMADPRITMNALETHRLNMG
jgi:hypothetical protein